MTDETPDEYIDGCMGCGEPFTHDEAYVNAAFLYNCHGGAMLDSTDHGAYHHDCLLAELRVTDLPARVGDVWGDYDEFTEHGPEYVAWLIEQQAAEMLTEDWDYGDGMYDEAADIAIVAMRFLLENDRLNPRERIAHRLYEHEMKGQEAIIDRYVGEYLEEDDA